jgi:hypothetical protein
MEASHRRYARMEHHIVYLEHVCIHGRSQARVRCECRVWSALVEAFDRLGARAELPHIDAELCHELKMLKSRERHNLQRLACHPRQLCDIELCERRQVGPRQVHLGAQVWRQLKRGAALKAELAGERLVLLADLAEGGPAEDVAVVALAAGQRQRGSGCVRASQVGLGCCRGDHRAYSAAHLRVHCKVSD